MHRNIIIASIFAVLLGVMACDSKDQNQNLKTIEGRWTPLTMSVTGSPMIILSPTNKGSVMWIKQNQRVLQLQTDVEPGKCFDADKYPGLEDAISSRYSKCIHKASTSAFEHKEDKLGTYLLLEDPTTNSDFMPPFGNKLYYRLLDEGKKLETQERSKDGRLRITTWKRKIVKK